MWLPSPLLRKRLRVVCRTVKGRGQTSRREGFMVVFRPCNKCYFGLRASFFGFSLPMSSKFVTREVHVGSELDELMQRHVLYWKYFDHLLSVLIPPVLRIHLCHPRDGKWAHDRPQNRKAKTHPQEDSVGGIKNRLRAGQSGVPNTAQARDYSLLNKVHPASYSARTFVPFLEAKGRAWNLPLSN